MELADDGKRNPGGAHTTLTSKVQLNLGWVGVGLLANAVFFRISQRLQLFFAEIACGKNSGWDAGVIYSLTN